MNKCLVIEGKTYKVIYVPKEETYPAFGYSSGSTAVVREDLSPRVKKFVEAHELYHCRDKFVWWGWIGREMRANIIPGLKDPIGLLATVFSTLFSLDRLIFYFNRFRKWY